MCRLVSIIWLGLGLIARAGDLNFDSGPQRVHLIELFTSQGCSSCPPAEAWLSKLKSEPGLWKSFVPLAFHVDYWDRLGWRDPFAAKEWTARQYQYSENWRSEGVYTPGFVLDGRELSEPKIPATSNEKPGVLRIEVVNGEVSAQFTPANAGMKAVHFHLAQLGFDLTNKVTAGENNGRNLRQDFVVLSLQSQSMSDGKIKSMLPADSRAGAIAAWVTANDQLDPIQAIGGWLR